MYRSACAILALLFVGLCAACGPKTPSAASLRLRLDIVSGLEINARCFPKTPSEYMITVYHLCVDDVEMKDTRPAEHHDPFCLGLYFGAWLNDLDARKMAAEQPNDAGVAKVETQSEAFIKSDYKSLRKYQTALGISDSDLIDLVGLPQSRQTEVRDALASWESQK